MTINKDRDQHLWDELESRVAAVDAIHEQLAVEGRVVDDPDYVFEAARADLAEQIYRAMEDAGLNESQLAAKLDMSRQAINQALTMKSNFTLRSLVRISLALGRRLFVRMVEPGERIGIERPATTWANRGQCISVESINRDRLRQELAKTHSPETAAAA